MRRIALFLVALVALAPACGGAGRPTLSEDTIADRECSADGMVVPTFVNDGIPDAVARRRQALIDAAVACDYRSLRQMARHDGLDISFDGQRIPAAQWEAQEAEGLSILRPLAGLLSLNVSVAGEGADRTFTWPTAVEWPFADVADGGERAALAEVVGEAGIYGWAETGSYAGWRTTIDADGTWKSFYLGPVDGQGG